MDYDFSRLTKKRILLTGATGFLGSHLCQKLLRYGAEVHAVSRRMRSSIQPRLEWWQTDLENLEEVKYLFQKVKPEIIFHLSGYVHGSPDLSLVLPTFHSLLKSIVNILTVATENECQRIIVPASLEEPDPGKIPSSPYAAAKWASSIYSQMFYQLYETPVVLARIFMTYGPGQPLTKVIPSTILSLLHKQSPKLSSGKRPVDWIYIDDVIDGLLLAALVPGLEGCTIDLGSGKLIPIYEIIHQLVNLINPQIKPLFGALQDRPLERIRFANVLYTHKKIGWQPSIPVEEGLRLTVDWFVENQNSVE
jgi:nucleoside-diphosphate-sugar epimerase